MRNNNISTFISHKMTFPYLYDNLTNKENKYMFTFMYVCARSE